MRSGLLRGRETSYEASVVVLLRNVDGLDEGNGNGENSRYLGCVLDE